MPTYNQSGFIRRAITSLLNQTCTDWELIIISDGSTDNTEKFVREFLTNDKVRYIRNDSNRGLGFAINQGLDAAKYDHIAYLPSDDHYFPDHLESLKAEFEKSENVILTFAKAKTGFVDSIAGEYKTATNGLFDQYSLQLVQVAHKKTDDRWVTRDEYVTDDLFDLFWRKLIYKGSFTSTCKETAYWTPHPHQHHKLVSENFGGGLNIYRQYYNVQEPIKIKVSGTKFIDEEKLYANFREAKPKYPADNPLKILIVGELAYNSERVYALAEHGHKLFGLWMVRPSFSFSTVGRLPFGNVEDIPYADWEKKVREIKPDIIYGTLNFGAIDLAHEVLTKCPDIPFVWHFKEGPFLCLQKGLWGKLIELYDKADGKIYLSPETKDWYGQFISDPGLSFIMDGDLPKKDYFTDEFSPRLSEQDGAVHTVVPGRMIGAEPSDIKILADNNIHVHLYTENYLQSRQPSIINAQKAAPDHFHTHPHCSADQWVTEFSKYDAGWLHCFDSRNKGVLVNAEWNDLNMPARMNTLAAAGLPMIQKANEGHIVAMRSRVEKDGMGVFFNTFEELAAKLKDKQALLQVQKNVREHRYSFSFDHYVPRLIEFFREAIKSKNNL